MRHQAIRTCTKQNYFMIAATKACKMINQNSNIFSCAYLGVYALQVSVVLPGSHEDDGLPAGSSHGDGRANLVINCVKLSEHYSIDCVRIVTTLAE